jgi:hypothetical protein
MNNLLYEFLDNLTREENKIKI